MMAALEFTDFLIESMDTKPVKWNRSRGTEDDSEYQFSIEGNRYLVKIYESPVGAAIEFSLVDRYMNPTKETYSMTGTGNQFQVLATVIDCAQDYVKRFSPDTVNFTGSKTDPSGQPAPGRVRVYSRLAQKFFGSKYTIKTGEMDDGTWFVLRKK